MKIQPYFLRMGVTALVMSGLVGIFASSLWSIFQTNPRLNALILALTMCGIVFAFFQLFRLKRDAVVLTNLKQDKGSISFLDKTSFLEPILAFVSQKKISLDPSLARSLADNLADRLDNERVFPRYLIGLLVFLGLLGTFWGLSQTIGSIAQLIQNMPSDTANSANFVSLLKESLQEPLKGMGTAFSSSLFGLGGSLLVGFLELQVGHAYGRFLNEVDIYLTTSSQTQDNMMASLAPASYIQALLTRNVESIDQLNQMLEKVEKNERQTTYLLDKLITSLTLMTEQNKTHQHLMVKLAEGQLNLQNQDGVSLKHLHNIEQALSLSLHHQRDDREELLKKLQEELRLIARTIANANESQRKTG